MDMVIERTHTDGKHYKELNSNAVVTIMSDDYARPNPYQNGYGIAIPTRYRIKLSDGRTRRVYMAGFSNAGSPYVNVKVGPLHTMAFLDTETEHRLSEAGVARS